MTIQQAKLVRLFAPEAPYYRIAAELPGLVEKDVEVTVNDDAIVLNGEKSQEKEAKNKDHYYSERSYDVFRRSFALPKNADRKAIDAKFAKGVLTVTHPQDRGGTDPAEDRREGSLMADA